MLITTEINIPDLGPRIALITKQYMARKFRNMCQACADLGMSTNNLYRIWDQKNKSISLETLLKIEKTFIDPAKYPESFPAGESLIVYCWERGADHSNPLLPLKQDA